MKNGQRKERLRKYIERLVKKEGTQETKEVLWERTKLIMGVLIQAMEIQS